MERCGYGRLHLEMGSPRVTFVLNTITKTMAVSMRKSRERKHRQRKRGIERNNMIKIAYEESKKALIQEQRLKKSLERENMRLRSRVMPGSRTLTHTKASILCEMKRSKSCSPPSNIRSILWNDIKDSCIAHNLIGTGVFARCYLAQVGSLDAVCIKLLHAGDRYKSLIYSECKILSELCHVNLPWVHGMCIDSSHTALVLSYHSYCGDKNASVHIHDALNKKIIKLSNSQWRQVLLGCISALVYLKQKNVLHNDIKSDNILIERLPRKFAEVRGVLIDFNKACLSSDARKYTLSDQDKQYYAKHHPHIAPEVRNGYTVQSFASDVYSMGRIIRKINDIAMGVVPIISSTADMCTSLCYSKRPTAEELEITFSSLTM